MSGAPSFVIPGHERKRANPESSNHERQILILRSAPQERVSKDEASWFETRSLALALLTMRMTADGYWIPYHVLTRVFGITTSVTLAPRNDGSGGA